MGGCSRISLSPVLWTGLVLAVSAVPALAGNIRFSAAALPPNFQGRGLNDLGQVAGAAFNGVRSTAALSFNGVLTDIGATLGPADSEAVGINNAGQVTGNYYAGNRLFFWSGGPHVVLAPEEHAAAAINASAQVAGTDSLNFEAPGLFICACSAGGGTLSPLAGVPGAWGHTANALNARGDVAGTAYFDIGSHAMKFVAGAGALDLGALDGAPGHAWASGINGAGQVVGTSTTASGRVSAFRTVQDQMVELPNPAGDLRSSAARAINDGGQIVGYWTNSEGFHPAFVFGNGVMRDLRELTDTSFGTIEAATAINAHGQILAAYGPAGGNSAQRVLLSPKGLLAWTGAAANNRMADAANWDSGLGFAPNPFLDLTIGASAGASVVMDASAAAKSLELGSGASLNLSANPAPTLTLGSAGLTVLAGGSVLGKGVIAGNVNNAGQIRPAAGSALTLKGSAHTNTGTVDVPAGAGFTTVGTLANGSGGVLRLANTSVNASGGLSNSARVELTASQTMIGDRPSATLGGSVHNAASGVIFAAGGQRADFTGALTNAGDVQATAGTRLVYAGPVSASGRFSTDGTLASHRFVGAFGPGSSASAIGTATIGNVEWLGRLTMELGPFRLGRSGPNDVIVYAGSVTYLPGSALELRLTGGLQPRAGDSYGLFVNMPAPGKTAPFFSTVTLPPLAAGLSWDVEGLRRTGVLRVLGP